MKRLLLLCVAATAIFSSCSKESLRGSGSTGSKVLSVPAFTAVESHYDIKAVISYGATQEITMTGYNNLLDVLDVTVQNGVLKLKFNSRYNFIRNGNVVANIRMPLLSSAVIHGSQNIEVSGFTNGANLTATIHGSGNIRVFNSSYQSALLQVNGSGHIEAQGLQAKQAEATINGSGNTSATVTDRLKAAISGSGNIYYWGNPVVDASINGSGKIIRR